MASGPIAEYAGTVIAPDFRRSVVAILRRIPWDSRPGGAGLDSPGRSLGNTWPPQPIKAQRAVTRWRSRVTARWALIG